MIHIKINALYLYETDDEAKCKAALLKESTVPKLEAALYQQRSLKAYCLSAAPSTKLNKGRCLCLSRHPDESQDLALKPQT
ncbi:hypothetical protein [Oceanisphaera sp. IT1-181]|uniref:hypothetical protein n=1 Tax=Oceanisphaera sp. IT1-181 TaxID=3081199 RepID=UPI0029CA556D|nr:hypothetical protein [Oceanisphaera sp. IT1-181]